jgi:hypothetical protein
MPSWARPLVVASRSPPVSAFLPSKIIFECSSRLTPHQSQIWRHRLGRRSPSANLLGGEIQLCKRQQAARLRSLSSRMPGRPYRRRRRELFWACGVSTAERPSSSRRDRTS